MRRACRQVALGIAVCVALLTAGCADPASEPVEASSGVLGVQVERDGDVTRTFEPTAAPATATEEPPSPAGEPSDDGVRSDAPSAGSTPEDTVPPAPVPPPPPPPPPSPSPSPSPSPDPVALASREGHSYVTWFRNDQEGEDGEVRYVWGEVSVAPSVTREGSEPLRVSLVDLIGDDDPSAPRRAQCPAWLEVDGDRSVRARGTLTVEVVVDGEVVSAGTRDIDVTAAPGSRRDLVAIGDVRVTVPEVAEVTCRVRFEAASAG